MDLSTTYLGIALNNPVIVGASPLTFTPAAVERCAQNGAAAVVMKSLFEEQIRASTASLDASLADQTGLHGEVFEYLRAHVDLRYGTRDYLNALKQCKAAVDIPVFASINCLSDEWWIDFAQEVEAAGADSLELNIALIPTTMQETGDDIELRYRNIVAEARAAVSIPVAVKLGAHFTSLPQTLLQLVAAGADGFVLFNRFYRPTIDIDRIKVTAGNRFSSSTELSLTLRWVSFFADRINADIAAATAVHTGQDLVRVLLAGARAAQVVTALYRHGIEHVAQMLEFMRNWMQEHGFDSIDAFRGKLSQQQNPDAELFNRYQYMEALGSKLK